MTPLASLPVIALMAVSVVAYGRWLDRRKNTAGIMDRSPRQVLSLSALRGREIKPNLPRSCVIHIAEGWERGGLLGPDKSAFSRSPRCADTYRVFPQIQSAAGRLGKGAE